MSWIGCVPAQNVMVDWLREANVRNVAVHTHLEQVEDKKTGEKTNITVLTVYTNRPGLLIGPKGDRIAKYQKLLKDLHFDRVELIEVDDFWDSSFKADIDQEMNEYFRARGF